MTGLNCFCSIRLSDDVNHDTKQVVNLSNYTKSSFLYLSTPL